MNTHTNPYVMEPVRRAYVNVLGRIWQGCLATHTYKLSNSDLQSIGEFTRNNVRSWLNKNAGDFQSINDFEAVCGQVHLDWASEEGLQKYYDIVPP